ncbi:UPF0061 protein azo1574, partial [Trifolium pratense]
FERQNFPLFFSGATPLVGVLLYAQCYGGHQFGIWVGQLGDGRVITLGAILNSKSERWELRLKGAGKTPYSRFADALQCSIAASGNSFAVKRCITWGYRQPVLFVL